MTAPMPNWDFGVFGFTGTRQGMTQIQARKFMEFMLANGDEVKEFHHGMSIGADAQANDLMAGAMPWVKRVGWPSTHKDQRVMSLDVHERMPAEPPLHRNLKIIEACQVLCACPSTETEVQRSGTWMTIRHAMKTRMVVVFSPSGLVTMNNKFMQDETQQAI